jgi:phenylacetate-CoA ligase
MRISVYKQKRRLYEILPGPLRRTFGWIPFPVLAGRDYRETAARDSFIDHAAREEIMAYQEKTLGRILEFACEQVPAYRKLRPVVDRHLPFEALKAFPLLDKEHIQKNFKDYLPKDIRKIRHYECTTGGTTGNQLKFYLDDNAQPIEMAFIHRLWARLGYNYKCRKATFRGVEFRNIQDGVYWQRNPVYNELQFSPYHMNEKTLGNYIERLLDYQPSFIHGYPSAVAILAGYILRNDIDMSKLRLGGVLLGSEALFPGQRETIERAFSTRAFSWYGHSERLILAGECEKDIAYHHFPDYGILEIIDEQGEPARSEGDSGELVGTGLYSKSLPLIRYRTGDKARRLHYKCKCHRNFDRFDKVEGRWKQEYVIGKNNSPMSLAALNMHGPMFDNVIRYQYYQKEPGLMDLRVMITKGFSQDNIEALKTAFNRKTGDELIIEVKVVDQIPLTPRGKLRRLVQDIPQEE